MTLVIAHRGDSHAAPENTLAAIRSAIQGGIRYIEVDIRRTHDGALVLMHDRRVDRTTDGSGAVDELNWDQVRRLDAGTHGYPREPVPRLEAILPVVVAASGTLVIEAKSPRSAPGFGAEMLRALDEASAREHVVIASFDHVWLRDVARNAPDLRLAELWLWPPPGVRFVEHSHVVSVFWSSVLLDPTLVARVRRARRQLWVWTVNTPGLMRQVEKRGVDGLITSNPVLCRQTLRGARTTTPAEK